MWSERALTIVTTAVMVMTGMVCLTVIAIFYHGDAATLIGTIASTVASFLAAGHVHKITSDNKQANAAMEEKIHRALYEAPADSTTAPGAHRGRGHGHKH